MGATLVAVSKTKPVENILELYREGHRDFGENRVQELQQKQPQLPENIRWHLIGHLQRNKVKYIAPYIALIHSVDSSRLLQEIQKQGQRFNRVIPCLLQVHIAKETTKFGFSPDELTAWLETGEWKSMDHVSICGLMGMATFTPDTDQVRQEFRSLKKLFDECRARYFNSQPAFKELSMGMSGDYRIALEEGSTMIRIGSLIFGARN